MTNQSQLCGPPPPNERKEATIQASADAHAYGLPPPADVSVVGEILKKQVGQCTRAPHNCHIKDQTNIASDWVHSMLSLKCIISVSVEYVFG